MKKKSIIVSVLTLVTLFFSATDANAQAMLQGNPSWANFIGSPGMWVITAGVLILIAFVLVMRKGLKLIPEPVRKKQEEKF